MQQRISPYFGIGFVMNSAPRLFHVSGVRKILGPIC